MKRLVLSSIILGMAFLLACSSGKQDLQRGDYETSIRKAIDRLRNSPGNKKAQETLREAYPLMVKYHTDKVANLKTSNKTFKWETILSSYLRLNGIYESLQRCPACLRLVNTPQNFTMEADEARTNAAEARYQQGLMELDHHERESAKRAYKHFQRAEKLKSNYKDARQKMEEALHEATLKVVIEKVPSLANHPEVNSEYFNEKIVEYFKLNANPNEFVRFYSTQEARDVNLQKPDHYVMMSFQSFAIGRPQIKESTINAEKDSVIIGQVDVEGETRDVYGTVTAKITVYEKTMRINGTLSLQVVNAYSSQNQLQEQFPSEYIWTNRWGNFNGDERALTNEQKEICSRKEETLPQSKDLFIDFSRPIFEQVTNRLTSYYRSL